MLERISDLEIEMTKMEGQNLAEVLEDLLTAYCYVLKTQFPSYISLELFTDDNHRLAIAKGIARLKGFCISQMSAPDNSIELISRAYSNVCAFAELQLEFK